MKRFLPFLIAVALPAASSAKNIGPAEAEAIAADFMHLVSPATAGSPLKKAAGAKTDAGAPMPYYIYNAPAGGYVVVAGDDRLGTILGYSDRGAISPDSAPDGLRGLLGLYENAYAALSAMPDDNTATPMQSTPAVVVAPLLGEIEWGQDSPFNTMTPTYTSGGKSANYYTGCVACAATQIMRLYSWPQQGSGSKTYTDPLSKNTLSADFGATVYDWANMPAAVPIVPTDAQTKAYSTLAAQMGVALEMQYEAAGSGTYDMLVPYALRTYFGYDAAVRSHNRTYYSTTEWMDMIKTELDQGRPVFYGGTSDGGTGGHAFVVDGYDSADYVHINWGWYGRSNGYFMINHLDPTSLGEGGGAGGYNLNQDMVTGIQPAREGSARDHSLYGGVRLSLDGPFGDTFNVMTYLENIDVEPFTGRVEAVLTDADGNIAATLGGDDVTVPGFSKGYSGSLLFNPRTVKSTVSGVADGTYRMCLGYKADGEDAYKILRHPKGKPAYADVVVSRGYISIAAKHVPAPDCVLTEGISTDGELYAGGHSLVSFTVENRSADYVISDITLRLTSTDDPTVTFDATVSKTVYDRSTEDVELLMPVPADVPAGRYTLTALVKNSDGEYLFDDAATGRASVDVRPATGAPVVRACSDMIWRTSAADGTLSQGDTFYGVISLRNAASAGSAKVLARFINETTGVSSPLVQVDLTFSDSRAQTVTFSRYLPFDPGKYRIELFQVSEDYRETPIAAYGTPTVVEVLPSESLVAEMESFTMPERLMQNTRYTGSLTYKGLTTARMSLYIRLRQLTNKNGGIIYMGSQSFSTDVSKSLNFNFNVDFADGLYMVIAETGTSSAQLPMGNYAAYGRIIPIGNVEFSGTDIIEAEERAAAIWVEGRQLHIVAAGDNTARTVAVYTPTGALAARDTLDLSALPAGFYIVEATLANGHHATAKILLR